MLSNGEGNSTNLCLRVFSVNENLNVKVTDVALSRDLFPNDYVCLGDNENRPVRWMAVEALADKTYSYSTDTVSMSVILVSKTFLRQYTVYIAASQ